MRLKVLSPTPPLLFEEAARQVFTQVIDLDQVGEALREKVAIEAETLGALLQEWVVILVNLVRVQNMVFKRFQVTLQMPEKGPYSLQAEAVGELIDPQRHELKPGWDLLACQETLLRKEGHQYYAEINLTQ